MLLGAEQTSRSLVVVEKEVQEEEKEGVGWCSEVVEGNRLFYAPR